MSNAKLKSSSEKLLTEAELELMTIIWKLGEGSVADVIAGLPEGKDLAYTTVSTILRILEQKKVLKTRKEGRGHIYVPIMGKLTYEARAVKDMVGRVFDGTPAALVRQLISSVPLNQKELDELKRIIEEARGRK